MSPEASVDVGHRPSGRIEFRSAKNRTVVLGTPDTRHPVCLSVRYYRRRVGGRVYRTERNNGAPRVWCVRERVAIGTGRAFRTKQKRKKKKKGKKARPRLQTSAQSGCCSPAREMRLSEFRYTGVLVVQLGLLAIDLLFNTFIHRYLANTGVSILLFV